MALSQGQTGTTSKREGKRSWLRQDVPLTCLHPEPLKPIVESILCVAFLAMLSQHTVGQSLDSHWSTAWLGYGLLWLAARNAFVCCLYAQIPARVSLRRHLPVLREPRVAVDSCTC